MLILQSLLEDVQANVDALTEVISSTKKFLEENRDKLNPEQIAAIEGKLEEARKKSELLRNRAEDSRKDLQKVMTTAIKQETAKVKRVCLIRNNTSLAFFSHFYCNCPYKQFQSVRRSRELYW